MGRDMEAFDISSRKAGPGKRVLFGLNILVVEDSQSASNAVQLLAASLGARVRKAPSVAAALRHLSTYRPNIVIVDLGLPDGSGLSLLKKISTATPPNPGLVAISGADPDEWADDAREAGAGAIIEKPIGGVEAFANAMLAVLPDGDARRGGKQPEQPAARDTAPAVAEDLDHIRESLFEALSEHDMPQIAYCQQFLESLVAQTGDDDLSQAISPLASAETDEDRKSCRRPVGRLPGPPLWRDHRCGRQHATAHGLIPPAGCCAGRGHRPN